ncbi:ribonuclease H-like domain-containing protein [Cytobacillus gottheilii]|uniref:ribonuclease H-like domain-containing protein n=1 Tax=Cytobacillus gottheilii TaxID=859144 RepID=UPI0009BA9EAC|nr:ribonuclease H-like domain-containing protein [Cytobacillus gottheilii]
MSLKNKLNRLKPHLGAGQSQKEPVKMAHQHAEDEIPFQSEWQEAGFKPFYFDQSYCLVREKRYHLKEKHGTYSLYEFIDAVKAWNQSEINHPLSAAGHKPSDLFFFDTETTGLGGGAGNTIFLLGHASIAGDEVIVKQHVLPHPGAEVALYQSFLTSVDYTTMVTYNGKAFDWPQVKTRHTLIRDQVPKLPPFGHFDLYHGARRLWKHQLERMKLSIVEKDILGIQRQDDIPGYLAPMIYYDFLESKNPEGMLGIIRHNEIDILSLISLYTHLSFQLLHFEREQTAQTAYETGRWYASLGETTAAESAFKQLLEGDSPEKYKAKHELAKQYKKDGKIQEALPLWREVAEFGELKQKFAACIELAKYYEHKEKQYTEASHYAHKANMLLSANQQFHIANNENIQKRLNRLEAKMLKRQSAFNSPDKK